MGTSLSFHCFSPELVAHNGGRHLSSSSHGPTGGVHFCVNGVIFIPSDSVPEASKYDYLSKTHIKYINEMNPTVIRIEYIVYRKIDGKVLGKLVSYGRVGGDMPTGIGHDSSFSCSQITGVDTDLEKKIFSIEGVQR